jgi:hypothetical protein
MIPFFRQIFRIILSGFLCGGGYEKQKIIKKY